MGDVDKYRGLHGLNHTPGPLDNLLPDHLAPYRESIDRAASQLNNLAHAVAAQEERDRQQAEREAQEAERRELAALSRPQSMVRDALAMGGCPHRALAMIADDDLAVARQLLADAMEARRD